MKNPWLEIPLTDYEGHMALPEVGQGKLLADVFEDMLNRYHPRSIAVLGCAGGNGFDRISTARTNRVVAIDLNSEYIDHLYARFHNRIPNLELIIGDVHSADLRFRPVEFVFTGLLLEYVDVATVLNRIQSMLVPGGTLGTVIQLACQSLSVVTPSPFRSLQLLTPVMRILAPSELKKLAAENDLYEIHSRVEEASGGKRFSVQEFHHTTPKNCCLGA